MRGDRIDVPEAAALVKDITFAIETAKRTAEAEAKERGAS